MQHVGCKAAFSADLFRDMSYVSPRERASGVNDVVGRV